MKSMDRRNFLINGTAASIGLSSLLAACGKQNNETPKSNGSNEIFEWKLVTSWPQHFPILGEYIELFAKQVEIMTNGRLKIHVYGGGELVPPMEAFDAVSQGVAEMFHAASYYWAGKIKASQFFTSIPFGMDTNDTNAWLFNGDGLKLWQQLYDKYNLIPFPAGNTGTQMGGWFNKKINSADDLKGLKIRIPGLGGKIVSKAGASAILSPGSEIYTNLERGVIGATDWIGPYHDYLMGFHKIAKYYYFPSWAEPTGVIELCINKNAFNSLPEDIKEIVKQAAFALNATMLAEFESKNAEYLTKIQEESNVEILQFPESVLEIFKKYSAQVIQELVNEDEDCKKVYESYSNFIKRINSWKTIKNK